MEVYPMKGMKVLILWRGQPHPAHPSLARPFYFIKHYASKHSITLVSPSVNASASPQASGLGFTDEIELESAPCYAAKSTVSKALSSVLRRLTYTNLRYSRDFNLSRQYLPCLQRKVNEVLKRGQFDVIYSDYWTYSYLYLLKLTGQIKAPVVLEFFSPALYSQRCLYRIGSPSEKLHALLRYISFRSFEVKRYRSFEAGIYVSKSHLELSKPFVPRQSFVIPPGIDLELLKPLDACSDHPSVLFIGSMNYKPNVHSVLHFYSKVYPHIKREIPDLKFYVLGRDPDSRVKKLLSDPSVVVTGTVEDVRPYLSMAHVFVNPIVVDDGGIKSKVLETMAMAKAVVSTPMGVRDIGATEYENVVIARDEREFAEKVIELLRDENERKRIGINARRFVEENYSWDRLTGRLEEALEEMLDGH